MKNADMTGEIAAELPSALPAYMKVRRWFRSKARRIKRTALADIAPFEGGAASYYLALVRVDYEEGPHELYYLPLSVTPAGTSALRRITTISIGGREADVGEATEDGDFNRLVLEAIGKSSSIPSREGSFRFDRTDLLREGLPDAIAERTVKKIDAEQSNTSIVFGKTLIMKNYRMIEEGTNPDFDISHFLTTRTSFRNFPPLAGYIEYGKAAGGRATIAMLQDFIDGAEDCWAWTCSHLKDTFAAMEEGESQADIPGREAVRTLSRDYLAEIAELGRVTARFHCALASDSELPAFAPEAVTREEAGAWIRAIDRRIGSVLDGAARTLPSLPPGLREGLASVIERKGFLLERVNLLSRLGEEGVAKIRVHGDYHLGQVLVRRDAFYLLDFEGEPARALAERKAKNCALKDIAGMIRSFDYAASAVVFEEHAMEGGRLEAYATAWRDLARRSFLDGYREAAAGASFLPASRESFRDILSVYEIDKAVYELDYEMNNRPDWLKIPVRGLLAICEPPAR